MGTVSKKFQRYPNVDNDGDEFQRIDMHSFGFDIHWFSCDINVPHRETQRYEVITHHSPHDGELNGPTTQATVGRI
jgi:hypothetical protein